MWPQTRSFKKHLNWKLIELTFHNLWKETNTLGVTLITWAPSAKTKIQIEINYWLNKSYLRIAILFCRRHNLCQPVKAQFNIRNYDIKKFWVYRNAPDNVTLENR